MAVSKEQTKPVLYIPVGMPGAGKSTYGQILAANQPGLQIVSTDAIREELYGDSRSLGDPGEVFGIAYRRARDALRAGQDVYFDATNLTAFYRRTLREILGPYAGRTVCIFFKVPPSVCRKRNESRTKPVPTGAFERLKRSLERPSKKEGFTELWTIGLEVAV